MSFKLKFSKLIDDTKSAIDNDLIMKKIVMQIAKKINQSKIVKMEYKKSFDQYSQNEKILMPESKHTLLINNSIYHADTSALILSAIYYLSDLNFYDYQLVNYSFEYGLKIDDIIILLLLNNIKDIEYFCKEKKLISNEKYNIETLKKLSALYKLQFDFQ